MLRSLVAALMLVALAATPALAQTESLPEGLDFPARAMALRPAGMALHRASWNTGLARFSGEDNLIHDVSQEIEVRVPLDALVLEAAVGMFMSWFANARPHSMDQAVLLYSENPEIGASFRDAPAPGWRYELGGSVTVPGRTTVAGIDGVDSYDAAIWVTNLTSYPRIGWNIHRYLRDTFAVVPHGRVEVDPIPEMAIGLEVDVPVLVDLTRGDVLVRPQVSLEIAARFEETCLGGLRAELTSYPDLDVLLEPFLRLAFARDDADAFVRLALRLPLGPAYPFVAESPVGYLGGSLEVGALF